MINQIEHNGKIIKIVNDPCPESPREWDNFGKILYGEKSRYILGDETASIEEMEEIHNSNKYISLSVYAYIHSGIALNTSGFSCPWDSGQCGIVCISKEKVRQIYNKKRISKKLYKQVEEILKSEIEIFSDYLNGEVYGFEICDKEGNCLDSCYGFYSIEDCEAEAKNCV